MWILEAVVVVLGVGILGMVLLALRRGEFDSEAPKYEMLDMAPPETLEPLPPGALSPSERIIRLGLIGAAFYYTARIGWDDPLGIVLAAIGAYITVTGLWGKDPFYRWLHARH